MTEKEIELSMDKALKKLPFEIRKIKFVLAVIKFFKRKQFMDTIKLISVNNDGLKNEALNIYLKNDYYFSKISDNLPSISTVEEDIETIPNGVQKNQKNYMINIIQVLGMMKQINKNLWMKKSLMLLQLEK